MPYPPTPLGFTMPIQLAYFPWWVAAAAFGVNASFVVLLGMRSMAGLGPVRKWVAIGARLAVVALLILIIGGVRWQRQHRDLEVILLNDISGSTANVRGYPGAGQQAVGQALESYYRALAKDPSKRGDDRIGLISFGAFAKVDAIPNKELSLDTRAIPEENWAQGTDAAAAIQLALATMSPDAMHRFVLASDGNWNQGDIDRAVEAAAAQHIPIDVVPLRYDVQNEILVDRFEAPSWKRENEPFNLRVVLRSTNAVPVTGKLRVQHQTQDGNDDLMLDPAAADPAAGRERAVTLRPGLNVETVKVPALKSGGVHRFHAVFVPDKPGTGGVTAGVGGPGNAAKADTLDDNNFADAFTFVQGTGKVLYVDNTIGTGDTSPGMVLARGMAEEGITFRRITIDQFPNDLLELQEYQAVVLANVPKGAAIIQSDRGTQVAGLSNKQDEMLRTYVHDMGGGLLMIGGPDTFGAGGWEGSEVEKILPVDMAIPAQRQIGKGALALIMHSCEMPQGNYWGEQCALQAVATLSARDEVGVISYGWGGGGGNGIGGAAWDFPLAEKGDGSRVNTAIKKMALGDMPSFDDALNLALNGVNGGPGMLKSNARHKHIIIVSDGDPAAPMQALMTAAKNAKISISTVTVFPHTPNQARPPVMDDMAAFTGGKAYGPIESNPNQLPQIFIKEATIVKRSLIHEPDAGIPLNVRDPSDDMIKGIGAFAPLRGMVLTSRKNDPKVQMPLSTGPLNDPILAHWQTGLGKSAAWASDAQPLWAAGWVGSPAYNKLFAQVIRGVSSPPMSGDFDARTTIEGNTGEVVVEAMGKDGEYSDYLNISGAIIGGGDMQARPIRLTQIGPGRYKANFPTNGPGSYVVRLNWQGKGKSGSILTGAVMTSTPEKRDLRSNEAQLDKIRAVTGGRVLEAFNPVGVDLFSRLGLKPSSSPLPIWDILLPWLIALLIFDVAVRRIAWDWNATKRLAAAGADRVRAFTTLRRVEARPTLDALKRVRDEVAETKFRTDATTPGTPPRPPTTAARPDPRAKFEAKGVEGDIAQIVGGATDKPLPAAPKKIEPKGGPAAGTGGHMGGLMAAKKRAQQQIKDKEQGDA